MPTILALDLATSMGFAVGPPGGKPTLGTASLRTVSLHPGAPFCALSDWLWPMLVEHKPFRLIFEAPMMTMPEGKDDERGRRRGGNAKTMAKLIILSGVVEMLAYRADIEVVQMASQTARKHFIGTGSHPEPKPAVMAECRRRGWDAKGFDESDAAALWDAACFLYFPDSYRLSYRT